MQLWSLQDLAQRFIPSIFAVVGKKNTPTIHLCNNHRVKHVLVTKVFILNNITFSQRVNISPCMKLATTRRINRKLIKVLSSTPSPTSRGLTSPPNAIQPIKTKNLRPSSSP